MEWGRGMRVSIRVPGEVVGPQASRQRALGCLKADKFAKFLPFWVLEFNRGQKC